MTAPLAQRELEQRPWTADYARTVGVERSRETNDRTFMLVLVRSSTLSRLSRGRMRNDR
jgi:hypothetical protein